MTSRISDKWNVSIIFETNVQQYSHRDVVHILSKALVSEEGSKKSMTKMYKTYLAGTLLGRRGREWYVVLRDLPKFAQARMPKGSKRREIAILNSARVLRTGEDDVQ